MSSGFVGWRVYRETDGSLRFQRDKVKFNVSVKKVVCALVTVYPEYADKIEKIGKRVESSSDSEGKPGEKSEDPGEVQRMIEWAASEKWRRA